MALPGYGDGLPGWPLNASSATFLAMAGAWSSWGRCLPGTVYTLGSPAAADGRPLPDLEGEAGRSPES